MNRDSSTLLKEMLGTLASNDSGTGSYVLHYNQVESVSCHKDEVYELKGVNHTSSKSHVSGNFLKPS